jgi:KipI family sensor histidine kinase inhibitor
VSEEPSRVRVVPVGPRALLAEVGSTEDATRLYAAVCSAGVVVDDLVPAARTVLLDGVVDLEAVRRFLDGWTPETSEARDAPTVEVPTTYDGDDLEDVARMWDMTTDEVVSTHAGSDFVVAFCGFSPGFAYCTGLPEGLHVPRLDSPRTRVPAGAVGLAGEFTGIYPTSSPGGWRLIGRTDLTLWDHDADPPARLAPGTRVRFTVAGS